MAVEIGKERDLTKTSTWAVAVVCLVLVFISLLLEHALHALGKRLHKLNKPALVEALEKIKSELMLMGFISLLLTVGQGPITDICVSPSLASTWLPCKSKATSDDSKDNRRRRLLEYFVSGEFDRRVLAEKPTDHCSEKGKVAFVSAYGIHQLHYFIFVLAIFHIFYCIITYILGRTKMRRWKAWENETKTIEYQYHNDPERFRFARDTSFGKRHLKLWSRSPILLWIVCFFRQFYGSVTKVDYLTLRHGFITAHLAPGSGSKFDFRKYIERSLEDDFKEVVGINGVMWFIGVLFLLSNTHGWNAYLWLPFIPLVIILLVGAKLQVIITQMGLRIQERGDVVRGAPLVQPSDELFWFRSPRLILFLIHLVLFQNAFQLAFFFWSWWKFGIKSCFHDHDADVIIRITMGVIIQFLCSYVTLPLYALVTQMGTTMRPTVFNDKLQTALKNWRRTAKKQSRHGKHSESSSHTPMSSMPGTPSRGMSPVHLLHNHRSSTAPNSTPVSPRNSNFDNDQWDPEAPNGMHYHYLEVNESVQSQRVGSQEINATEPEDTSSAPLGPDPIGSQHEIDIGLADFTFRK